MFIGPTASGKTSLVNRLIDDSFVRTTNTVIMDCRIWQRAATQEQILVYDMGCPTELIVAGLLPAIDVVFVVFDSTKVDSYIQAVNMLESVRNIRPDQLCCLLANKADRGTLISSPQGQTKYFQVSAYQPSYGSINYVANMMLA